MQDIERYGIDTAGKQVGTKEHFYAAWNRYNTNKTEELRKSLNRSKGVGKTPGRRKTKGLNDVERAEYWRWTFDEWRDNYVTTFGNQARGLAYEEYMTRELQLGGSSWLCQHKMFSPRSKIERTFDAIDLDDPDGPIAYEFKSGCQTDPKQLKADHEFLVAWKKLGGRIIYVFGACFETLNNKQIKALSKDCASWA